MAAPRRFYSPIERSAALRAVDRCRDAAVSGRFETFMPRLCARADHKPATNILFLLKYSANLVSEFRYMEPRSSAASMLNSIQHGKRRGMYLRQTFRR